MLVGAILNGSLPSSFNSLSLWPPQNQRRPTVTNVRTDLNERGNRQRATCAFGIPIIEKLSQQPNSKARGRGPAAVIFCPTRELAIQVKDVLAGISRNYVVTALYGGVAYSAQENVLRNGVDVVVATPGRAKDMLEKGMLKFDRVAIACLDEADHMLDIGFKDDIELLLKKVCSQNGSWLVS